MNLPDRALSMAGLTLGSLLATCSLLLAACAAAGGSAPPAAIASTGPGVSPAPSLIPEPTPTGPTGAALDGVPTGCYGLGEVDCRHVRDHVATLLTAADPPVRYIQIGPFGCPAAQGCPTTLDARPEGDVTIESGGAAIGFHVRSNGGVVEAVRQEVTGVSLPPTTKPPLPAGPQPFALGHCGLWSGVDIGGTWWDPIGVVDSDHGDSINPAEGTILLVGPDQAMFTSKSGFSVLLVRHPGAKYLPLCQ
jgi:hypothetical protein